MSMFSLCSVLKSTAQINVNLLRFVPIPKVIEEFWQLQFVTLTVATFDSCFGPLLYSLSRKGLRTAGLLK